MSKSDQSKEICPNQLSVLPTDGRWLWKGERDQSLVYVNERGIIREKSVKENQPMKIDLRTGSIRYRKQSRLLEPIIKTKSNEKITLQDVIQASLNVISEMFYIPIEFEEYIRQKEVQEFLLYLLNYFYWFLEMITKAATKSDQQIDWSNMEKERLRLAYAHVLAAHDALTCKYAVLLLGVNLKDFHHMRNGDLFYSCTQLDQTIFESLLVFSMYFTWINFYRQHFNLIREELARLFRVHSDLEILQIPLNESLEGRMTKSPSIELLTRHRLINCSELLAKKAAKVQIDDASNRKSTMTRAHSVKWNLRNTIIDDDDNEMHRRSTPLTRQSRLRSLLAKDSLQHDQVDDNDELYQLDLHSRSPYHRQRQKLLANQRLNRIRGLLTRQLKSRNQSLTDEPRLSIRNTRTISETVERIKFEEQLRQRQKIQE